MSPDASRRDDERSSVVAGLECEIGVRGVDVAAGAVEEAVGDPVLPDEDEDEVEAKSLAVVVVGEAAATSLPLSKMRWKNR